MITAVLLASALACPAAAPPLTAAEQALLELRVDSVVVLEGERATGSGVVVSRDGLVITSAKVAGKLPSLGAQLFNGVGNPPRRTTARVLARDDWFALLQLEGAEFKAAPLGNSEFLEVNDRVFAVDHPGGAGFQLVLGGVGKIDDAIPTLVPYNPAGVGGPLFNLRGEVVGVLQAATSWPPGGTRASKVEDVRAFLARMKARVPPRQVRVRGEPGMEVQPQGKARMALPASLPVGLGEPVVLVLYKGGRACGVLRPDTSSLEPVQDLELGASQPVGTVDIATRPAGAAVEVDGQWLGESPAQLDCMPPGPHALRLSLPGHAPDERVVPVHPAQQTGIELELRRLAGLLTLDSQPSGAEVWVDRGLLGVTPLVDTPVPPGRHVVSLRLPGGARVRKAVNVVDQRRDDLGTVAVPAPGALVRLQREQVDSVHVDGHEHPGLEGYFVVEPGARVVQAVDELGNVMTDAWDAPAGGLRVVEFRGDGAGWARALHGAGLAAVGAGVSAAGLAALVVVGMPALAQLAGMAASRVVEGVPGQLWLAGLSAGLLLASPLVIVSLLALPGAALLPRYEQVLAQGSVVRAAPSMKPVPFTPTRGWEPRPVAGARDGQDEQVFERGTAVPAPPPAPPAPPVAPAPAGPAPAPPADVPW